MMIGVITADIVNSTQHLSWEKALLPVLEEYGESPKDWVIYRGDSLQCRLNQPQEILLFALKLKAAARSIKGLDIRLAIGIGEERSRVENVARNDGQAYEFSGRLAESFGDVLVIATPWNMLNTHLSVGLELLSSLCNEWTPIMSQYVLESLNNLEMSQAALAKKLNTSQANLSKALSRAHWHEVRNYLSYFEIEIKKQQQI